MDDLLVIGGGPVGLSSAIYAAQAGLSVTVLEAKVGIIDKACGEGLMPGGVKSLKEMGVIIPVYQPLKGIRYVEMGRAALGRFKEGEGWGIRRNVLHNALQQRAQALGVNIEQHRATDIQQDATHVTVDGFKARYLIAADGLKSPTRRKIGLHTSSKHYARYGLRQHYPIAPWTDGFVEIHLSPLAEAYITPVSKDTVGIAILFSDKLRDKLRGKDEKFYQAALAEFPALQKRIEKIKPCTPIQGAGPFKTTTLKRVKGRILLAGDAAGYLDPMTGEGLRLGFAQAKAAVAAITKDKPQTYEKSWKQLTRHYWFSTSLILLLRKTPVLSKLIVPVLALVPSLFDWILTQIEK